MMITKIETLQTSWRKAWFTSGCLNDPRSIDGRRYHSMNAFLLLMVCEMEQYKHPVFVTFNRATAFGAKIRKGAKSVPVFFWMLQAKNPTTGEIIGIDDYNDMSAAEKSKYDLKPFLRCYNVFNIEQTTIEEDAPKAWAKATKGDTLPREQSEDGMFVCPTIDFVVDNNAWLCPIKIKHINEAFYNPSEDLIQCPEKKQYDTDGDKYEAGMEYYSTILHEMAHSTGAEKRLNRLSKKSRKEYGREELVAELTAAVCGKALGFAACVQDNNAADLKGWCQNIKEKPQFLISVLSDVAKAVDMMRANVEGIKVEKIA